MVDNLLTSPKLRRIDSDEETFHAARLGVLHVSLCDFAIAVHVQLDEESLVVRLRVDDIIERTRCKCGDLM